MQSAGLSSIASTAGMPSATQGAVDANRYMTSGALLNPDNNPYLQKEFHTGANAIENQIASEFAGNGSNVINSVPVQQQGMADLASQLYGNAYSQGLTAMNQASALAPSIDAGTYTPGQALLSAGGTQQNQEQNIINAEMQKYNYGQQLPENMLSWYSGLLNQNASPFGGSSSHAQNNPNQAVMDAGLGIGAMGLSAYAMPMLAALFAA
jgi:hypothetical protein